ncbi:MAG: hypothetical protein WCE90_08190 [Candidatus Zixiibacteriota bacterium]
METEEIKNKVFYQKCKGFITSAFRLLEVYLKKGESIPETIIQDISLKSESEWEYPFRRFLFLPLFVLRHERSIEELPEFIDCKRYMFEEESIKKHLDHIVGYSHAQTVINADSLLSELVYHSFDDSRPFEYNPDRFDRAYSRIEDLFYGENIHLVFSAPLQNFHCELETINLAKDLRIVRMSREEREDLWRSSRYGGWLPDSLLPHLTHILELDCFKPKICKKTWDEFSKSISEENPEQIAKSEFDSVVSALRLFKPGVMGFSYIRTTSLTWFPLPGFGGFTTHYGQHFELAKYVLSESEAKEFETFFEELFGRKSVSHLQYPLDLALNRFNYAYERKRPEDKLIDYMIAFEALYGAPGYMIALRAASLLGNIPDEKKQIFSEMKEARELRDNTVHGSTKKESAISAEKASRIEDHLRHSLQQFIKRKITGKTARKTLIDSLEKTLLS